MPEPEGVRLGRDLQLPNRDQNIRLLKRQNLAHQPPNSYHPRIQRDLYHLSPHILALLGVLKDSNAIDYGKMLVSILFCLESAGRILTFYLNSRLGQILLHHSCFPKGELQTRLERATVEMRTTSGFYPESHITE